MKPNTDVNSGPSHLEEDEILDEPMKRTEKPQPLRALLRRPVVISVANHSMIALLDITAGSLVPLVWSTDVEFGGLNMNPASIGLWLAGYGFLNGIFQFVAFPHIVGRFGPRGVFITCVFLFFPFFVMFPLENLASRHPTSGGLSLATRLFIMLQLSAMSFSDMGFGELTSTSLCMR